MPELQVPAAMSRVALIAPSGRLRAMLVVLARSGSVQLVSAPAAAHGEAVEALRRLERAQPQAQPATPRLLGRPQEVTELERHGKRDLLLGEVELMRRAEGALHRDGFALLVGWVPRADLPGLSTALAAVGAAALELPRPALVKPPTLLRTRGIARRFAPLLTMYGAPRYADVDPTPFAALSFLFMFAMMFGDAGHGLMLAALGFAVRAASHPRAPRWLKRLSRLGALSPFAIAGGLLATLFGLLYGEAFGPTGIIPTLWVKPLDHPTRLLGVALAAGVVLLTASYGLGIINRVRESGFSGALRAASGVAGLAIFAGGGLLALALYLDALALLIVGALIALAGMLLLFGGFYAESGGSSGALAQALIEVLDAVIRLGANVISFTRLAAFGLMHAALGLVVLDGARSLWHDGPLGVAAGALLFALGTAAAFALEALVATVQAMRLEYYELFSRVFAGEGEPFSPWSVPVTGRVSPT